MLITMLFSCLLQGAKRSTMTGCMVFLVVETKQGKKQIYLSPGDQAWVESLGIPPHLLPGKHKMHLCERQAPIPAADLARPGSYAA